MALSPPKFTNGDNETEWREDMFAKRNFSNEEIAECTDGEASDHHKVPGLETAESADTWDVRYNELLAWKNKTGNCLVPKSTGSLGRWASRQREIRKRGELSRKRISMLESIGFVWDANEQAFETRLKCLEEYKRKHGHVCVPSAHPSLGMFVAKTRARRRKNRLSAERIARLDALGFVWSPGNSVWRQRYNELCAFFDEHGTSNVPTEKKWNYLGWWCISQRQRFHRGNLSPDRIRLLNAVNFDWYCADSAGAGDENKSGFGEDREILQGPPCESTDSYPSSAPVTLSAQPQRPSPQAVLNFGINAYGQTNGILASSFSLANLLGGMSFTPAWTHRRSCPPKMDSVRTSEIYC